MKSIYTVLLIGLITTCSANQIASNGNIEVTKNQKYVCANIGSLMNGQFIPQEDKEFALKYPRRFYVDNKNILHTDDGSIYNFIKQDNKSTAIYGNQSDTTIIMADTKDIKMISIPNKKFKGITLAAVYSCFETDNWTLGK